MAESLYPAKSVMPHHTHETAHISLVLQGNFTEKFGRKTRETESSTLIIHPPDEDHAVVFHNAGARVFSLHINPHLHERLRDYTKVLDSPAALQSGHPIWLATQLYRESKTIDEVAPLMLEALALEIIAAISRHPESSRAQHIPRWLEQVREYLHAHFAEHLSFALLAGTAGVHPVYLAREFRRAFHCTMGEYVRRLRIEAACGQLSGSDLPLNEIALAVGFCDQSHFSNAFKRLTGATPARYRTTFQGR